MYTIRYGTRIRVDTPAKLNFFLELHERRSDGYHELDTLMVPISLYDSLHIQNRNDNRVNLDCRWAAGIDHQVFGDLPVATNNLVHRALQLLRTRAEKDCGADVWLQKRIPSQAGLGGASSDAAAALVAGNELWRLGLSLTELLELAEQLGSDIPFFLRSSPARCLGRGEIVRPMVMPRLISLVVVKPPVGLATAEVYRGATVGCPTHAVDPLLEALRSGDLKRAGGMLFNRLEAAARRMTPWIEKMANVVSGCGVLGHQMSGSGTSYFALCQNRWHARQIAAKLRAARLGSVFVATTLGPNAA
jgi:4-diphosphocytidyl-2-C-methyl-D-erythritol kinase